MKLKIFLAGLVFIIATGCTKKEEMSVRKVIITEIGKQNVCPVTKNKFTVTGETRAIDYKGQTYYFCCPGCDSEFIKEPDKYIGQKQETRSQKQEVKSHTSHEERATNNEILYWTCSMHPQVRSDKPGKCPICAMTLIPIYKGEEDKTIVDENTKKITGLKSQKATKMHLTKIIRLPGRVASDNELYLAQQEYILSYKNRNKELLEASKFRLSLLGYNEKDIYELQKMDEPDKSLIYPGKNIWVYAEIYEYDTGLIKPGLSVDAIFSAYPNVNFKGVVRFIEPTLNQQTRSAKARVFVEDPARLLKLEMYAVIEIKINPGKVLSIPENALIDTGTRKLVYLDLGNGRYKPQEVKTGFSGEGYVEIVSGMKEGDAVVTDGNFMLDSQSTLTGGQSLLYGGAEEVKSEKEKPKKVKHKH
ncbi:MAG: efflux RND transporter periplasmic adaptor subunit [Elusimicrobia bacterium]|nr:efflux RND transporter periplasmic adaptor subunit [Elusimicrobiota bacterium]